MGKHGRSWTWQSIVHLLLVVLGLVMWFMLFLLLLLYVFDKALRFFVHH